MAKTPKYIRAMSKSPTTNKIDDDIIDLKFNMKLKRRIKLNITDKLKKALEKQVVQEQRKRHQSIMNMKKTSGNIAPLMKDFDS